MLQYVVSSLSYSVNRLRADCSPLSTGALNGCLRRVTILDAVTIQFDLLKMSYSVHRLRADCSPLSTGALSGCLWRVTIPDAVTIQFDLLKMSMVLLETCGGL